MEPMKVLGDRIRTERIAQGYSVKTAAAKSGIARDTWRKIEAGGSVQDTKRFIAMQFLGLSDANTEWGTVGSLEDHAADPGGMIDLNLMFSQAVRFAATVGTVVPAVREEAERVTVALSELFAHGLEQWDRTSPFDRDDDEVELILEGGDGDGDSAPTRDGLTKADVELMARKSTERPRRGPREQEPD